MSPRREKKQAGRRHSGRAEVGGAKIPRRKLQARSCINPEVRRLLVPYAISRCRESEAVRFEAHMLACPVCFRDLKTLDRAGALLKSHLPPPRSAEDELPRTGPAAGGDKATAGIEYSWSVLFRRSGEVGSEQAAEDANEDASTS
jgi:hypothetical protein